MEVVASGSILTGALQAFVDVALAVVALKTFDGRRMKRKKRRARHRLRSKRPRYSRKLGTSRS